MNIGDKIRSIREIRGLTQAELAERLGVSSKTVSSWEVNRTEPKMGMIEKVCVTLNCRKTDIIVESFCKSDHEERQCRRVAEYMEKFAALSDANKEAIETMTEVMLRNQEKKKED